MQLQTQGGTKYTIAQNAHGNILMRTPSDPAKASDIDGRWIKFVFGSRVVIGQPVQFICEPQKPGFAVTLLNTSKITGVIW